jgi:signal transduction histidine kinase
MTSLRARLLWGAGLWLAASLVAGGLVLHHAFLDAVEDGLNRRLDAHLLGLAAGIDTTPDGAVAIAPPKGEPRFDQPYSGWYWQVSDGTRLLARSRSLWDFALTPAPPPEGGGIRHLAALGPQGQALAVAERDLIPPDGTKALHVTVAADRSELDAELARFRLLLGLALGGLGLGLMGAVWFQVGYGLRPLGRLAAELERLMRQGGRLGGPYPAEVAPLASALNRVLDHDARLIEAARAHLGNLAHGLKTPLAVMRAELATARPDSALIEREMAHLTRLVDIHLSRARAEAARSAAPAHGTAIAPIAQDLAAAMARIHGARALAITLDIADGATLPADGDDLAEILGNLLDNACKWAATRVVVSAGPDWLAVEDDGPGLTPDQAMAATRRGMRLDESVPGSGLGLHIVADLAAMLDLDLEFGRAELGGLRVSVTRTADGSPGRRP